MSRSALILTGLVSLALPATGRAIDPHLDPGLLPTGCSACHAGHGVSRSPMLSKAVNAVCLDCHDAQAGLDAQVRGGRLQPGSKPPLLGTVLASPFTHPMTSDAVSRFDAGAVTCSSCHSPHRGSGQRGQASREGVPKISTRDPAKLEYELCEECHGSHGPGTVSPTDASRQFDPASRSFHPVHVPAQERAPSTRAELRGRQVSCTDCHGASRDSVPPGPHGSDVRHLLKLQLADQDGSPESQATYAMCYSCHSRETILSDQSTFPLHRLHVVAERTACSTCHSAHGSLESRAMIRFGEETTRANVLPSTSTGRLAFESETAGAGACFLSCHGIDHAPKSYGSLASGFNALRLEDPFATPPRGTPAPPQARDESRPETREKRQPPPP